MSKLSPVIKAYMAHSHKHIYWNIAWTTR